MAWSRSSPNPCSTYSVVLIGVVTCLVRTVAATDISSIIAGEISALAPALADAQAPSAVLTGMERDAAALQVLRQSFSNADELQAAGFQGWKNSNACSNWTGVRCDNSSGRVISLDLSGWGIQGEMSPRLVDLDYLQKINLTSNNLHGTWSSNWGSFQNLTVLDVSNNPELAGALPTQWGQEGSFPSLQYMMLGNTGLSGQLPTGWGSQLSFPSIKVMDLSSNILQGVLPSSWATVGAFPNLTVLNLANNTLSGTLVSEWGNDQGALPALRQLDLHANHLTGLLPRAWGSGLPSMVGLQLASNMFTGKLPAEWAESGRWPNLTSLNLANNILSGTIPSEWGAAESGSNGSDRTVLTALKTLTLLPGNYLCGEIPEGIAPVIRTADAASIPDRLSIQQYNLGPCVEPPPLAMYPPTGSLPAPAPEANPAAAPLSGSAITPAPLPPFAPMPQPAHNPVPMPMPAPVPLPAPSETPLPAPAPTPLLDMFPPADAPMIAPAPEPGLEPAAQAPAASLLPAPHPAPSVAPAPAPHAAAPPHMAPAPLPAPAPALRPHRPPGSAALARPAPAPQPAPFPAPAPVPVSAPGPVSAQPVGAMGLSPAQLPVGVQQQPSSEPVRAPAPAPVPAPLPAAVATAVQAPPSPPPPPPSPPSQPLPPPPAPPVIVFPWQANVPAVAPATADNPFYLQNTWQLTGEGLYPTTQAVSRQLRAALAHSLAVRDPAVYNVSLRPTAAGSGRKLLAAMTLSSVDATFLINTTNSQLPVVMSRLGSFYLPNNFSQELGSQGYSNLSPVLQGVTPIDADGTPILVPATAPQAISPPPVVQPPPAAVPSPPVALPVPPQSPATAVPVPAAAPSSHTGIIAGVTVGVVAALVVALVALLCKRRRRRGSSTDAESARKPAGAMTRLGERLHPEHSSGDEGGGSWLQRLDPRPTRWRRTPPLRSHTSAAAGPGPGSAQDGAAQQWDSRGEAADGEGMQAAGQGSDEQAQVEQQQGGAAEGLFAIARPGPAGQLPSRAGLAGKRAEAANGVRLKTDGAETPPSDRSQLSSGDASATASPVTITSGGASGSVTPSGSTSGASDQILPALHPGAARGMQHRRSSSSSHLPPVPAYSRPPARSSSVERGRRMRAGPPARPQSTAQQVQPPISTSASADLRALYDISPAPLLPPHPSRSPPEPPRHMSSGTAGPLHAHTGGMPRRSSSGGSLQAAAGLGSMHKSSSGGGLSRSGSGSSGGNMSRKPSGHLRGAGAPAAGSRGDGSRPGPSMQRARSAGNGGMSQSEQLMSMLTRIERELGPPLSNASSGSLPSASGSAGAPSPPVRLPPPPAPPARYQPTPPRRTDMPPPSFSRRRSDGQELHSRPPPGSRLDQSEADLRARVVRALKKKLDSQAPGRQGLAAQIDSMQTLQRADFEARAMSIVENLRTSETDPTRALLDRQRQRSGELQGVSTSSRPARSPMRGASPIRRSSLRPSHRSAASRRDERLSTITSEIDPREFQ